MEVGQQVLIDGNYFPGVDIMIFGELLAFEDEEDKVRMTIRLDVLDWQSRQDRLPNQVVELEYEEGVMKLC